MSGDRVPIAVEDVWPDGTEEDEGVVVDWYVREGAAVEEGQTVATIQVEKVSVDVPAPATGALVEVALGEDETFARGDVIGYVEAGD